VGNLAHRGNDATSTRLCRWSSSTTRHNGSRKLKLGANHARGGSGPGPGTCSACVRIQSGRASGSTPPPPLPAGGRLGRARRRVGGPWPIHSSFSVDSSVRCSSLARASRRAASPGLEHCETRRSTRGVRVDRWRWQSSSCSIAHARTDSPCAPRVARRFCADRGGRGEIATSTAPTAPSRRHPAMPRHGIARPRIIARPSRGGPRKGDLARLNERPF